MSTHYSKLIEAINEWCLKYDKFSFTVKDLKEYFRNDDKELLIACSIMRRMGIAILKRIFDMEDDLPDAERMTLFAKFRQKEPILSDESNHIDPKVNLDTELINLTGLRNRSDDLLRAVSFEKKFKKLLDKQTFDQFVASHWPLMDPSQTLLVLKFIKIQTELRIMDAKKQLEDAKLIRKTANTAMKAAIFEKKRSFQAQQDRLEVKLKFIKIWLGQDNPDKNTELQYDLLVVSNSGSIINQNSDGNTGKRRSFLSFFTRSKSNLNQPKSVEKVKSNSLDKTKSNSLDTKSSSLERVSSGSLEQPKSGSGMGKPKSSSDGPGKSANGPNGRGNQSNVNNH